MRSQKSWCSFKRVTVVVCCFNLVAAFFVLRPFFANLQFGGAQARRIQESERIRGELESTDLVNAVARVRKELYLHQKRSNLPQHLKRKLTLEILQRLNNVSDSKNVTEQRAIVELWRAEKLQDIERMTSSKSGLFLKSSQEVEMLKHALQINWFKVMEDISLWIPDDVNNTVHNDKPANEHNDEDYIIPGPPLPPNCNPEPHTDYAGDAVRWGLTHHKASAADCCKACMEQSKRAKPGKKKCNIWVYCPSKTGCYSPDIYEHKHQECWLKQADVLELNFKDNYSESYRSVNPKAPLVVPWMSGVVSL